VTLAVVLFAVGVGLGFAAIIVLCLCVAAARADVQAEMALEERARREALVRLQRGDGWAN
jgi:hypothetical protein